MDTVTLNPFLRGVAWVFAIWGVWMVYKLVVLIIRAIMKKRGTPAP